MKSRSALETPSGGLQRRLALARGLRTTCRHAHLLAGLQPRVGLHALGVDPHLARAQQLLQVAVADVGEMHAEPAVEAQAGLVARDLRWSRPARSCQHQPCQPQPGVQRQDGQPDRAQQVERLPRRARRAASGKRNPARRPRTSCSRRARRWPAACADRSSLELAAPALSISTPIRKQPLTLTTERPPGKARSQPASHADVDQVPRARPQRPARHGVQKKFHFPIRRHKRSKVIPALVAGNLASSQASRLADQSYDAVSLLNCPPISQPMVQPISRAAKLLSM